MIYRTFLFAAMLLLVLGGCGVSDPSYGPVDYIPVEGDNYRFLNSVADMSGKPMYASDTLTLQVDSEDTTVRGRGQAVTFTMPDGKSIRGLEDELFYESNGDISVLTEISIYGSLHVSAPPAWVRLPFGSRVSGRVRTHDTMILDGETFQYYQDATYLGTEVLTIGSTEVLTRKVRLLTIYQAIRNDRDTTHASEVETIYWFAPGLGYFARVEKNFIRSTSAPVAPRVTNVMVGYSLKQ